jgi:hypothetical protein
MSDYGDNYAICNNDYQREWYQKGWEDAKSGAGDQSESRPVPALGLEFYRFGLLDGSG